MCEKCVSHGVMAQVSHRRSFVVVSALDADHLCSEILNYTASRSCSENNTAPSLDANCFMLSVCGHYDDIITSYSQTSGDIMLAIKNKNKK